MLLQVKQKSAKVPHNQSSDDHSDSDDDSSDSDDVLEDYLANLQCDSDGSNSYEQQVLLCSVCWLTFTSNRVVNSSHVIILQELRLLEQVTATRVGHQAAAESMQEAAQGGTKH